MALVELYSSIEVYFYYVDIHNYLGTAKRVYGANDIRAKLPETARTWISACFFVKNLKKFLQGLFYLFSEISHVLRDIFNGQAHGERISPLYAIRW